MNRTSPPHRLIIAALATLATLVAAAAPSRPAAADSTPTPARQFGASVSFSSLGYTNQTLLGATPSLDVYVPGPGVVPLGEHSALALTYTRSPLLDGHNSSVSLFVNDLGVGGQTLRGGYGLPATLVFPLAASALLSRGFNHLQLRFALRDNQDQSCANDPALQVTVSGTSLLRYDVPGSGIQDLARLPAPFLAPDATAPERIDVSLPAQPSAIELTAIGRIAARLGADRPSAPPLLTTHAGTRIGLDSISNAILVGTARDNPAIAMLTAPAGLHLTRGSWQGGDDVALPADEGLIVEVASPWNKDRTVIAITGNGQEGIRRAGMVLSSRTLRQLLQGSYALLPKAPSLAPPPDLSIGTHTLADLGYQSLTLEGFGDHEARYSFDMTRIPSGPAKLDLLFGHGVAVDEAISGIRVDLNGYPVASRQFHATDPGRIELPVTLPADHLQLGTNLLSIRVFLNARTACSILPTATLYTAIDKASSIIFPSNGDAAIPDLQVLPYPLLVDGRSDNTVLVLPDNPLADPNAFALAVGIGARASGDAAGLSVLSATQATDDLLRGHTVLIDGLSGSNRLAARVAATLPLKAIAGQPPLQIASQIPALGIDAREGGSLAVVAETPAPWDATQAAVIVSATRQDLLPLARQVLLGGGLSGTLALIDGTSGGQHTFDLHTSKTRTATASGDDNRPIAALLIAALALLLIVLALVLARYFQRQRRPR